MTMQSISSPGMTLALLQQTQPNHGDSSHQTWLRELERAQAGMFGAHGNPGREKHQERSPNLGGAASDSKNPLLQDVVVQAPAVTSWIAPQALQAAAISSRPLSVSQTAGLASVLAHPYAGGLANGTFVGETENLEAVKPQLPEVGDTRPGREAREFSRNSFKLVRSGEDSLDAAVRDPAITLESELRLGQQIRTAVQAAGSKLGKVWLNGRAVMNNSKGEKNGN